MTNEEKKVVVKYVKFISCAPLEEAEQFIKRVNWESYKLVSTSGGDDYIADRIDSIRLLTSFDHDGNLVFRGAEIVYIVEEYRGSIDGE